MNSKQNVKAVITIGIVNFIRKIDDGKKIEYYCIHYRKFSVPFDNLW